jgi:hypothetical protein
MIKRKLIKYDLTGKRSNDLTPEEYGYFASLSIDKRREIIFDNYLIIYPNTLFANQIIIDREKKKKKSKVTLVK